MRYFLSLLMAVLVLCSTNASAQTSSSVPFFMFSTYTESNDPIREVLRKHVTTNDYLSLKIGQSEPDLASRIGHGHLYLLVSTVKAAQEKASGCTAGLIVYDGEHWAATPQLEQADMPAAIATAKSGVAPSTCGFGLAPDGQYAGLLPKSCTYDIDRAIHRKIDFNGISLFDIQAQRLLSDKCASENGLDNYVNFVTAVARDIHAKNPSTKVSAQLSFRYTPPDRMITAIQRLRGVVDGFYFAYPLNVGGIQCQYCSAQNLDQVLSAMRS